MADLIWIEAATLELNDAISWYEIEAPDQIGRLIAEVVEAERLIVELPQAWHPLGNSFRSFRLNRFPYSLIYRSKSDLKIVAFMHQHRRPGYWLEREK